MRHARIVGTLLALFLFVVTGVILVLAQGGGGVSVIGGDTESLVALVGALSLDSGPYTDSTTVWVGSLPDRLPFALPLPDQTQVIGSIVSTGAYNQIRILLNSALEPEAISEFYRDALASDSWRSLDQAMPGGFSAQPFSNSLFCYNDDALLNIGAQWLGDTSSANLYIQPDGAASQCLQMEPERYAAGAFALIPQLKPPAGVTMRGGFGGGGGGGGPMGRSASSGAVLVTDIAPGDLIELYGEQLIAAGWRHVTTEAADGFAYSGWTIMDDDGVLWSGVLTLTANPAVEGEYYALVQVEEVTGQ